MNEQLLTSLRSYVLFIVIFDFFFNLKVWTFGVTFQNSFLRVLTSSHFSFRANLSAFELPRSSWKWPYHSFSDLLHF